MSNIVNVKNLTFGYNTQPILKDLAFELPRARFMAIAGPNGAGKTTLLNLLCALLRPKTGSIKIDEKNIKSYPARKLAQKIAVVRQEFVPVFDFTVTEVVSMARSPYLGTFGFEGKTDRQFVQEALELTDTAQFALRPLAELSGGERQRVFIARALAQNTSILLLDEPTTFLDLKHQVDIFDLLKQLQLEKNKTIIAITHDINLTIQYADIALLLQGPPSCDYQYGGTTDVFSTEQIERVFNAKTAEVSIGGKNFYLPMGKFTGDNQHITRNFTEPQQ
ncbi:MAG: ABC transporter ATP-binding protein [Planctomycetota bacterium]|jgi:iron complex transport system ATP-binding protein